jgi:hypothetical protein
MMVSNLLESVHEDDPLRLAKLLAGVAAAPIQGLAGDLVRI